MNNFNSAFKYIPSVEGGYSNRQNDLGGATNFGITQRTYNLAISQGIISPSNNDIQFISHNDVKTIYKNNYWDKINADSLPNDISLVLFDAAVISGPSVAVKTLQNILGLKPDGIIGRDTLSALQDANGNIAEQYIEARHQFFDNLANKTINGKPQEEFRDGWHNRLHKLEEFINSYKTDQDNPQTFQEHSETHEGQYTIQEGDTLSKIAERHPHLNYQDLAKYNNIENPDLVEKGVTITIPTKKQLEKFKAEQEQKQEQEQNPVGDFPSHFQQWLKAHDSKETRALAEHVQGDRIMIKVAGLIGEAINDQEFRRIV